jgi:hypothetical protein
VEKSSPKMWGMYAIKKLPNVNDHPIGAKKQPNLVTLSLSNDPGPPLIAWFAFCNGKNN